MSKIFESYRARQSVVVVQVDSLQLLILAVVLSVTLAFPCRAEEQIPKLSYEAVPDFFQLPPSEHFVEVAGVAVNSKGHIYVFHRGKHPLMEFDANGKYLRSIADDLFVTAHTVRVDAEDNIWTTDVGAHTVLKLSPDGRVLLSLGRMRMPGDDVLHFNQPTDVAFDRDGKVVGVLEGPPPDKGRHFDPHSLAVGKDNSIFTAEVLPWHAQKLRPK